MELIKHPKHDKLKTEEWLQLCVNEARFALWTGLFFGFLFGIGIGFAWGKL